MWQPPWHALLSVAGKLLARVMLIRLLTYVVDTVVPESQCGFRCARSTTDMIFRCKTSSGKMQGITS